MRRLPRAEDMATAVRLCLPTSFALHAAHTSSWTAAIDTRKPGAETKRGCAEADNAEERRVRSVPRRLRVMTTKVISCVSGSGRSSGNKAANSAFRSEAISRALMRKLVSCRNRSAPLSPWAKRWLELVEELPRCLTWMNPPARGQWSHSSCPARRRRRAACRDRERRERRRLECRWRLRSFQGRRPGALQGVVQFATSS